MYPHSNQHILFLHAINSNTTSALLNKGKLNVIKMFEHHSDLQLSAEVSQQENSLLQVMLENEICFKIIIYLLI